MKREGQTREKEVRYIGLDVHKHYITVGGMNRQQEIVLRARNVAMERFKRWAAENLHSTDEVVLESSTNTWDIYDTVAPLVKRIVVAHPAEVKQIANARVTPALHPSLTGGVRERAVSGRRTTRM
jgi:hypothetical protein